jgi:hypothetical protein
MLTSSAQAQLNREVVLGCIYGDCENGRGTLVEETSRGITTYRGTFKNGLYDGFGRLSYDDERSVYKGYFEEGIRNGRGTYWDKENNVYIGHWKNNRRNGQGSQFYMVKDWSEDKHGEGWLRENTENYSGNFQNDVFLGEGTYRWEDGTKYVGEWAANKKHGEGYFDYGNGNIARRKYEFDQRVVEFGF